MRIESGFAAAMERVWGFAVWLSELRGWRRYLASFVAGALSVLALPPYETVLGIQPVSVQP